MGVLTVLVQPDVSPDSKPSEKNDGPPEAQGAGA